MTTIAETLQALKEEFASLPDGFARYAYLTELSARRHTPASARAHSQTWDWQPR